MMSSNVRPAAPSSWSAGIRRTTTGWSTPISRIEWTSSPMWSSSKTVRGCRGFGRIESMSSSANSAPGTTARPAPSTPRTSRVSDVSDGDASSRAPSSAPVLRGVCAATSASSSWPRSEGTSPSVTGPAGVSWVTPFTPFIPFATFAPFASGASGAGAAGCGCFCSAKKTSTGRPAPLLGALGMSAPRPRPSARRFSAIAQPLVSVDAAVASGDQSRCCSCPLCAPGAQHPARRRDPFTGSANVPREPVRVAPSRRFT